MAVKVKKDRRKEEIGLLPRMGRSYCLSCSENVETNLVRRHDKTDITCVYCGFTIEVRRHEDRRSGCVFVADPSEISRTLVNLIFRERQIAGEVMVFEDGQSFFRAAVDRLEREELIDLVIIDIETPVVDGVSAARMFRALEEKHGRERVPIVFFSKKRPDGDMRKRMTSCRPVRYMNKGETGDPDELLRRIKALVARSESFLPR